MFDIGDYSLNQPELLHTAERAASEVSYTPRKHIKGIVCDVHNCGYNDGHGGCTAEKIAVGPCSASTCTDTVCATFKPRSGSSAS